MAEKLHVDIETFSSVDIAKSGAYKYIESDDFEILIFSYALNDNPVKCVDLTAGEKYPQDFIEAMNDDSIEKWAHNAVFERLAFTKVGFDIGVKNWFCSAIKASYSGLPLSLSNLTKALRLEEKGKLSTGKALIKFFCCPTKPKKINKDQGSLFGTNKQELRNRPADYPEKWAEFKRYCNNDVEAERAVITLLERYKIPFWERQNYILDQQINDNGIEIDLHLAQMAVNLSSTETYNLRSRMQEITGLQNPNSTTQLREWIGARLGREITTLGKASIPDLIAEAGPGPVTELLQLRQKAGKTSIAKYTAMLCSAMKDNRSRGLFQFYGARTGRWAGRLVQLQNLPQNHLNDLDTDRSIVRSGDHELVSTIYADIPSVLSQLIRTAFVAPKGKTFNVADFSAIEARVIAWLAGEQWRLDVFNTDGRIYEASAAMMFNVDISEVTKGSDMRAKGKIAELALGYQGSTGALLAMGGEKMGLSNAEMKNIVSMWRRKSPAIVSLWYDIEGAAKRTMKTGKPVTIKQGGLIFFYNGESLIIKLPSKRIISYWHPKFTTNRFGKESIGYEGPDSVTGQWSTLETYGGKLTENIVQAIARDLLMYSMRRLNEEGFKIVMHVHDEAICECDDFTAPEDLKRMCDIMGEPSPFCPGLNLVADGYTTPYYKKD